MEKSLREMVFKYVGEKYCSPIEYLWQKYPDIAVFRHKDNRKWFGIIMNIPYKSLNIDKPSNVDVLNVKINDISLMDFLLHSMGFLPAYHMNKRHWISILLDGSVDAQKIFDLIDVSFDATSLGKKSINSNKKND